MKITFTGRDQFGNPEFKLTDLTSGELSRVQTSAEQPAFKPKPIEEILGSAPRQSEIAPFRRKSIKEILTGDRPRPETDLDHVAFRIKPIEEILNGLGRPEEPMRLNPDGTLRIRPIEEILGGVSKEPEDAPFRRRPIKEILGNGKPRETLGHRVPSFPAAPNPGRSSLRIAKFPSSPSDDLPIFPSSGRGPGVRPKNDGFRQTLPGSGTDANPGLTLLPSHPEDIAEVERFLTIARTNKDGNPLDSHGSTEPKGAGVQLLSQGPEQERGGVEADTSNNDLPFSRAARQEAQGQREPGADSPATIPSESRSSSIPVPISRPDDVPEPTPQSKEKSDDAAEAQSPSVKPPVGSMVITSPFGPRNDVPGSRFHNGTDFRADLGDPVAATEDGVIEEIGNNEKSGNFIRVRTADGSLFSVAHTGKAEGIEVGQKVKAGQQIGVSDGSGTKNPHTHYTLRPSIKGKPAKVGDKTVDAFKTQLRPIQGDFTFKGKK